jgi:hypothetical protein
MDEEDMYGIPRDYYSHEAFQNYAEYAPTASIDEFRDDAFIADNPLDVFGEYMRVTIVDFSHIMFYAAFGSWDPSSDPSLQGSFEPNGTLSLDASIPDHPEFVPVAWHDQEPPCMRSTIDNLLSTDIPLPVYDPPSSHFGRGPVQYTNSNPTSSKERAQFSNDTQYGFSDNLLLPKANGDLREGSMHNSDGIRLRQVSELRSWSFFIFWSPGALLSLADMYRTIFKFGVFNAMQSSCFDTVSLCYHFK